MRRIGRYILNATTVASLLLCVAAAALWVQSRLKDVTVQYAGDRDLFLRSWSGELVVQINTVDWSRWSRGQPEGWSWVDFTSRGISKEPAAQSLGAPVTIWNRLGFASRHFVSPGEAVDEVRVTVVPYWAVALVAAALPLRAVFRDAAARRFSRLSRARRCTKCGYDLRATPDRCPECGTAPGKA
jgi:hypothetical protein